MMVTHVLRQKMVLLSMFFVVVVGFFVGACGASSSSTGRPFFSFTDSDTSHSTGIRFGIRLSKRRGGEHCTGSIRYHDTAETIRYHDQRQERCCVGSTDALWSGVARSNNVWRCAPTARARRICLEGE